MAFDVTCKFPASNGSPVFVLVKMVGFRVGCYGALNV